MSTGKYLTGDYNKIPIGEVMPLIGTVDKKERIAIGGELVHVSSLRLMTFKTHGTTCSVCGREGSFFILQGGGELQHLGLYSDDGIEMTKFKLVPKKEGGLEVVENTTTMCSKCNEIKNNERIKI